MDDFNSDYGSAIIGSVTNDIITFGVEDVFNTQGIQRTSVASFDGSNFVIAYVDDGNSYYGTAILGEIEINNYYVDASRPDDSGDGLSWSTAKQTIHAAIDLTGSGDIVNVADGTYNSGTTTVGSDSKNRVHLNKTITVQSVNGAGSTSITGASDGGGYGTDAIRPVYMTAGTLDGFTISGGYTQSGISQGGDDCGGGLWISGGTVTNCIITANNCDSRGGGIWMDGAGTISNSTISDNGGSCGYGGGINMQGGGLVTSCIIKNNTSSNRGGGIFARNGGTIANCLLTNNESTGSTGGGVHFYTSGGSIINSTISGNISSGDGGGINIESGSSAYNCIAWGNTSSGTGNDIKPGGTIAYCCASDGITNGVNNCTTADPLFLDVGNNDYHIRSSSPCADAGNNTYFSEDYDIRGSNYPRKLNKATGAAGTIDMGAYEYNANINILYVDASIGSSGDGLSWGTAFKTIQEGVDASNEGYTVNVADGTYNTGTTTTPGYVLNNRVYISKDITVVSVNDASVTTIEGAEATGGGNGADAIRGVYMSAGILDGFKIAGGYTNTSGSDYDDESGGGVWISDGMISNCLITLCDCNRRGGGIWMDGDGTISNSTISDNGGSCEYGGGINMQGGGTVEYCIIDNNESSDKGGGAYVKDGGTIVSCLITNNESTGDEGGGVNLYGNGGSIVNSTLSGNTSDGNGGGISLSAYAPTVYNCIAWDNNHDGSDVYDDIYPGNGTVEYCCASDGVTDGEDGCIISDPLFVDSGNGNYRLSSSSPCKNTGDNTKVIVSYDLDGNARIVYGTVDMGAYEYNGPEISTTAVTSITKTTASSGGNVTSEGASSITAKDVCWNTAGTPTISDEFTTDGTGTGTFTSSLTGLTSGETYYVRAYATNSEGTAYGNQEEFTTAVSRVVINNNNSGAGSLRQAIDDAGAGDDITFNLSSGDEIISIDEELEIYESITIDGSNTAGSGVDVTVKVTTPGTSGYRVFNIDASGKTLNISNMTIKGGDIGDDNGGSIYLDGTLNLESVTVSGSKADYGGGIYVAGGAINIDKCTLKNNEAAHGSLSAGGAIRVGSASADVLIANSIFSNNTAIFRGGGIYSASNVTISNSTLSDNTSENDGGALYFTNGGTLTSLTIANNHADYDDNGDGDGGGLYLYWGTTVVKNCIFANNYKGSGTTNGDDYYYRGGPLTDEGYNIVEYQDGSSTGVGKTFTAITNITGNQANLFGTGTATQSLADNGGSTQTLAIYRGSVAIEAGVWDASITTDQRGEDRYNPPTIGAYEFQGASVTWDGSSGSDWNTADNWNIGSVPVSSDNLTIPDVANDPEIGFTGTASCNNLTLVGSATLTVKSDATGTGSLIVNGTASGNVTVQRYADVYAKGQKWHYVSAPVSGQALSTDWMTANAIGFTDPAYQFFRFSEISNYWIYFDYIGGTPENFGDNTFVDARGYCLSRTSDGVLSFSGTPLTNDVTYTATYTAGQGTGFNLVGNPFTSAIGVTTNSGIIGNFLATNTALLDDNYEALYIWDEGDNYTFGSQDYKVISNAAITGHTSIDQDFIAPGQAFMVKVVSSGGDIAFNTNMQTHSTAAAYKSKEVWPSVELTITGNGNTNSTAIGFNSEMTNGLDPSYDAAKFKGNPSLALYTKLVDDNGKDFAIQALPDNNIESFVIPVGVDIAESGVFEFSVYQEYLENYNIVLEDRQENTFTNLRWDSYFATISESGTGRFYLHFKDATAIGEITPETNITFRYLDGKIVINNPDNEKGIMSLVNVSGQVLARVEMNGDEMQEFSLNQSTGIYIISIQTEKANFSHKFFIK